MNRKLGVLPYYLIGVSILITIHAVNHAFYIYGKYEAYLRWYAMKTGAFFRRQYVPWIMEEAVGEAHKWLCVEFIVAILLLGIALYLLFREKHRNIVIPLQ